MKIEEIERQLTSADPEVLEQARGFITELLAAEATRGSVADGRAATTLGIVSVVAGFAVTAVAGLVGRNGPTAWLPLIGYGGALAFLIRGAYYCVRTVSPQTYHVITPDVIFDLQSSRIASLRAEIAYKMWQYERDIPPNSAKLFWLGRGQRGLFVGVAFLLVTALLTWIHTKHPLCLPLWGAITTAGLVAASLFVIDPIVERGRWRVGGHYSIQK
ncbi:MAG: DUF3040 domain-containing protein [Planctomycetes bacterium]|nr:DUF3040 domain-containing protein [Planctomycetota bacterium]